MMQVEIPGLDALAVLAASWNAVDIGDKLTTKNPSEIYRPLLVMTSQFTGKSKTLTVNVENNFAYIERYVNIGITTSRVTEEPVEGVIKLGTTDFPLGFYDVVIYENSSDENLDPTGLPVIWNGVMNLAGYSNATESVTYTEYTTNDADTESIYLTNPL